MAGEMYGDMEVTKRSADDQGLTDGLEDISGGVETQLSNVTSTTLFIHAEGATTITVEGSPDGQTWYTFTESPISFEAAGDTMIQWPYNLRRLRLQANDATQVRAQVREVI